jgi:hypothetical protein
VLITPNDGLTITELSWSPIMADSQSSADSAPFPHRICLVLAVCRSFVRTDTEPRRGAPMGTLNLLSTTAH